MKVFILIGSFDYEGDNIILVLDNKELAEEQLKKHRALKEYHSYSLEEWEVLR